MDDLPHPYHVRSIATTDDTVIIFSVAIMYYTHSATDEFFYQPSYAIADTTLEYVICSCTFWNIPGNL